MFTIKSKSGMAISSPMFLNVDIMHSLEVTKALEKKFISYLLMASIFPTRLNNFFSD